MKKWIFLGVIILTAVTVSGLWAIRVRHIICRIEPGACPEYYVQRLNFLLGRSLVFLPKDINAILGSYAEIANVSLRRKLPGTLIVDITLHQPFGVVNNYFVDQGGRVLGTVSSSALPRLQTAETVLPGELLTTTQLAGMQTLRTLASIFPDDLAASLSGQILEFRVGSTSVLLDVNSLPGNYSDSLQLIFTRGKVDGKQPKKVDMRFNNPIIVY